MEFSFDLEEESFILTLDNVNQRKFKHRYLGKLANSHHIQLYVINYGGGILL